MPHIEFADIDQDGWKDLVITGTVDYMDEKLDIVRETEQFTFIYKYFPKTNSFRQTYRHASFDLEHGPQSRNL